MITPTLEYITCLDDQARSASVTNPANMKRHQAIDAQELYDSRSGQYDDSHHPRLARHMVELAKVQSGENVLDLACGTGLVSFPASAIVGTSGSVVGVDISSGMLNEARKKVALHAVRNISFHEHSITELETLEAIANKSFDLIICCSALVLLEDAAAALKNWTTYLKPGGRLVVDVTHPMNLATGLVFERIGTQLQRPVPYYREPFQTPEDLKTRMEAAGLRDIDMTSLSIMDIPGTDDLKDYIVPDVSKPKIQQVYDVQHADRLFDEQVDGFANKSFASPDELRQQAKELFKKEWARLADADGKIRAVDGIYVGVGWKA